MSDDGESAFNPTLPEIYSRIKTDLIKELVSVLVSPDGNALNLQWKHEVDQSDCSVILTYVKEKHIRFDFTSNLVEHLIIEEDDACALFRVALKDATSYMMSAKVKKAEDRKTMFCFITTKTELPNIGKSAVDIALDLIYIAFLGNSFA